jgi:hypothetical protein
MLTPEVRNPFVGIGERSLGPLRGTQRIGQLRIVRILRVRVRVVDEVAVQVDIPLVHAAHPGEPPRVEGVDEHEPQRMRASAHRLPQAGAQQRHLAAGACQTLDAVRARRENGDGRRIGRAEKRHVEEERLTGRAPQRMRMVLQDGAGALRCFHELATRLRVIGSEALRDGHRAHALMPARRLAIGRRYPPFILEADDSLR